MIFPPPALGIRHMELWERWREEFISAARVPRVWWQSGGFAFSKDCGQLKLKKLCQKQTIPVPGLGTVKTVLLKTKQRIPRSVPGTLYNPRDAGKEQSFVLSHLLSQFLKSSIPEHFVPCY